MMSLQLYDEFPSSLQQLLAVGLVALSTFDVLYFILQVTIEGGEQQVYWHCSYYVAS